MSDRSAVPWYRQLWPWLLLALPATAVCVGSYLAYEAYSKQDPMVDSHYYASGQAINKTLHAGAAAAKRGLAGRIVLDPAAGTIAMQLSHTDSQPLPPVLQLRLRHPTLSRFDQTVTVVQSAPGEYSGTFKASQATRWDMDVLSPDGDWSLSGVWKKSAGNKGVLEPTVANEAADD
ncbi:FixH family protein [Paludibacterium yongneupense]|uniref:FixH family protein n=1 Tax=Paludibacterium yongneupense TaxID=400061 RepID=UPI000405781B|nr:FixH family protein [Paludibacterium yongneupense]